MPCDKAAIETLRAHHEKLFDRNQPIRNAEEMARSAERLGRTFEARAFLTVEKSEDHERNDVRKELERLSRRPASALERGRTLADVFAQELGYEEKVDEPPAPRLFFNVSRAQSDRLWSNGHAAGKARRHGSEI